jgi:hypothetical protein
MHCSHEGILCCGDVLRLSPESASAINGRVGLRRPLSGSTSKPQESKKDMPCEIWNKTMHAHFQYQTVFDMILMAGLTALSFGET